MPSPSVCISVVISPIVACAILCHTLCSVALIVQTTTEHWSTFEVKRHSLPELPWSAFDFLSMRYK